MVREKPALALIHLKTLHGFGFDRDKAVLWSQVDTCPIEQLLPPVAFDTSIWWGAEQRRTACLLFMDGLFSLLSYRFWKLMIINVQGPQGRMRGSDILYPWALA